jgi:hypothetical protein
LLFQAFGEMLKFLGKPEVSRELVFKCLSITVQSMIKITDTEHAKEMFDVLEVCILFECDFRSRLSSMHYE